MIKKKFHSISKTSRYIVDLSLYFRFFSKALCTIFFSKKQDEVF